MVGAAGRDDSGFVAKLARYAGARSLRALNHQVRLRNILTGTTCSPISLEDFELYLAYRELSIENLQFVIWFHDYQQRFSKLPLELQRMSPDPLLHTTFDGWLNSPDCAAESAPLAPLPQLSAAPTSSSFGSLAEKRSRTRPARLNLSHGGYPSSSSVISPSSDAQSLTPMLLSPFSPFKTRASSANRSPSFFSFKSTPATPPSAYPPSPSASTSDQPFREETLRIVATFMRPGLSKKELPLDESLREEILSHLAWTTHPNVFLPIYKAVYEQLELSVHHFLSISSTNINRPKQIYWYAAGAVFLSIAFLIALLTTHLIPAYKLSTLPSSASPPLLYSLAPLPWKRAYRLVSVPFSAIGSMQAYSAWRGFCSEVFGRGGTQLKAWELTDPKEVGVKWRRKKKKKPNTETSGESSGTRGASSADDEERWTGAHPTGARSSAKDHWLIAPFAEPDSDSAPPEDTASIRPSKAVVLDSGGSVSSKDSVFSPTTLVGTSPPIITHEVAFVTPKPRAIRRGLKRPPVFGPEKVVLDERIRNYHRSVMDDMALFGLCWTVIWTAIVVCIPGTKPRLD